MTLDLSNFTADQIHIVPLEGCKPSRMYGNEPEGSMAIETDDNLWVLRVHSKHQGRPTNFSLYFRNAVIGTRLVFEGPIVHEDTAYMIALPGVIQSARYGNMGRTAIVHEASVGDIVIFVGHIWQITENKALHDPTLTLIS